MTNPDKCPECGSHSTERVHMSIHSVVVEEVRICNECPTQYTVKYEDPIIEVDDV